MPTVPLACDALDLYKYHDDTGPDHFDMTEPLLLQYHYSGPGDLSTAEVVWREQYDWLYNHGYALRQRYAPDWIPSWHGTNKWWFACQDGQTSRWSTVMDATRLRDGRQVMLKRVRLSVSPQELSIARLLSNYRDYPFPLLEVLYLSEDAVIMVMPYLFQLDSPEFDTVGEVVDMFRQIFEGLRFMHSHGVAHRSIKWEHILMDASNLYTQAFHPVYPQFTSDFLSDSCTLTRTESSVRYHFVDFSLSKQYRRGESAALDFPTWDGEGTVPEFWMCAPCDPFAMDVYCLGTVIRDFFTHGHKRHKAKKGFGFIEHLMQDMIHANPRRRPTMDEVVARFDNELKGMSKWQLRCRIATKGENVFVGWVRSGFHWVRQLRLIIKGVSPLPLL